MAVNFVPFGDWKKMEVEVELPWRYIWRCQVYKMGRNCRNEFWIP